MAVTSILTVGLLSCIGATSCSSAEPGSAKSPAASPKSGLAPAAGDKFTNTKDGSVLVWIPGGEFTMGSNSGDDDEKPLHKVKVKGYWLGLYEVTNKQYAQFLAECNEREPWYWNEKGYNDPKQPVVGMTWEEVFAYCEWAGLRLPTEAEWEYAAAGGKQLEYPTATGAISHDLANFRGVGGKDRWEGPAPVGSFPSNPFGLFDVAGNAWEYTSTIYKPYPYTNDRENLVEDNREMMVLRGGSWGFSERYCRTTARRRFASHLTYDFAGFRVAKSGEPASAADSGTAAKK
jgi:formylglycine-generating enzyme required for sulfatase activity